MTKSEIAEAMKALAKANGYQIVSLVMSENAGRDYCGPIGFESDPHGLKNPVKDVDLLDALIGLYGKVTV